MREEGYYFIKFKETSDWSMGYWTGTAWYAMGSGDSFPDKDVTESRRLPVQRYDQVPV